MFLQNNERRDDILSPGSVVTDCFPAYSPGCNWLIDPSLEIINLLFENLISDVQ